MSRTGQITMQTSHAKKIMDLGSEIHGGGEPLGFPQAAFVVLSAVASGEYKLTKARKSSPKPKPEESEEKLPGLEE